MSEQAERVTAVGGAPGMDAFSGAFAAARQERQGPGKIGRVADRSSQSAGAQDGGAQVDGLVRSSESGDSLQLSPEAQEQLRKLKQRDAEVRAHEAAHIAAAGQYAAGGPTFEYQTGPDGRQYAIGGHVDIDVSSVPGDPEETERKAEQIRRAALAPASPSSQDSKVAATANQMSSKARMDQQEDGEGGEGEFAAPATDGSDGAGDADSADAAGVTGRATGNALRTYGRVNSFFANDANAGQTTMVNGQMQSGPAMSMAQGMQAYANASLQGVMPDGYTYKGANLAMAV